MVKSILNLDSQTWNIQGDVSELKRAIEDIDTRKAKGATIRSRASMGLDDFWHMQHHTSSHL